ncbi:hypothetical protein Q0590_35025 [Rhodocytophaga aerolata]|uniref:Uncharacterized protein n=1 Tax=Rhodocytophaga aerolata TaxID=455078 RepID=A0ABT8RJF1_9BACT|nr:hypothetical protein [Rhodocytophaga aerolata]MDO1451539.1 hypothetical protein [Rhodocytophaga aerolata]
MSDYREYRYIQPGDEQISFDLPLTLSELKTLHNSIARQYNLDLKKGFIGLPTQEMLGKLDKLIIYLQKQHYPSHD